MLNFGGVSQEILTGNFPSPLPGPNSRPILNPEGRNSRLSAAVEFALGRDRLFFFYTLSGTVGGGFKHFLFSPLFGEDFQFDEHIFEMG